MGVCGGMFVCVYVCRCGFVGVCGGMCVGVYVCVDVCRCMYVCIGVDVWGGCGMEV